jgi:hypothetical protein
LLNAPFIKIIGLYSNTGEGGTSGVIGGPIVGPGQLDFLNAQLKAAAAERAKAGAAPFALIIATHHPPFTGSASHAPSPVMLQEIDAACKAAGIWPDMHMSGHSHLYERFTRTVNGRDIPYIVAGMGGYPNLSGLRKGAQGQTVPPGTVGSDAQGNPLRVDYYNNTTFGFLRVTVSPSTINYEFVGVDATSGAAKVFDSFSLNLKTHKVTNGGKVPAAANPPVGLRPKPTKKPAKKPAKKPGKKK